MAELLFVQTHPLQYFTEEEKQTDYSERDSHYIRCPEAMEELIDTDAYIIDYRNEKIFYLTKNCPLKNSFQSQLSGNRSQRFNFLNTLIPEEDLKVNNV
ncbi:MAG: hypothetical protein LUG18_04235 [Candidatus Azobacteroides sp.]|nr:hypothetical protein [Candidatus Azobacteroides sp.]